MKKQSEFQHLKNSKPSLQHGGGLKNPQKRRRPLTLQSHNHFVLRSSKARGGWSFRRHKREIDQILKKFARRHHIGLVSYANVGNHLHLNLEISNRHQYRKFIRAVCSAIMMCVTGFSRWNKAPEGFQFWDYRPFSRVVTSWTEKKSLQRYFWKNKLEGAHYSSVDAQKLADFFWRLGGP